MMQLRIVSFVFIATIAVVAPPLIVLPFALAYAFRFRAYELLVLAAGVDAYFGVAAPLPYYTIVTFIMLIAMEWLKPHLSFHNR